MRRTQLSVVLASLVGIAAPGLAQESEPPPEEDLPSLDELLGIEEEEGEGEEADEDAGAPEVEAGDPAEAELERRLSAEQAAEQFEQALQLMQDVAGRLEASRDTGIQTQRLQEDIIRRLDMLIRMSEQQQQQSSSSSGSSQQGQQQQAQDPGQQQAQQQQGQREQQGQQQAPAGGGADVPLQEGQLAAQPAAGASWGNLPERVRDAVVQSQNEKFSAMYRALTEAYYRRLAEENTDSDR